MYAGLSCRIVH